MLGSRKRKKQQLAETRSKRALITRRGKIIVAIFITILIFGNGHIYIDAQLQQSSPDDMQGVPGALMQETDLVRITQKTPVLIFIACWKIQVTSISISMHETPGVDDSRGMDTSVLGHSELDPSVSGPSELTNSVLGLLELDPSVLGPSELTNSVPSPSELANSVLGLLELDTSVPEPSELDSSMPGSSEPVSKKKKNK